MKIRRPGTSLRRFVHHSLLFQLAGAFAILSGVGCAHHPPLARVYPPPTAADLAWTLTARQKAVTSMNARVRATSWLGGQRVRATVLMLVDRPGRLRLEAEVSLQGTVAILATDGQRFGFLDVQKNELRRGPACPANVASLIRIPLGPADVAAILLGDVVLPDATAGTVDWDPNAGADVLVVARNDGWLRLLFRRQDVKGSDNRLVGASATGPDGRAHWRVVYEDFATIDAATGTPSPHSGISLPQTIRFAEGVQSFDDGVEVKFKERTLNGEAASSAFTLLAPTGTATVEVPCSPGTSVAP